MTQITDIGDWLASRRARAQCEGSDMAKTGPSQPLSITEAELCLRPDYPRRALQRRGLSDPRST